MPEPLLVINQLTKSFPGQLALDRVDLEVGAGEIVALAGSNGSGKSTLVKILAGFHEPDHGSIRAFGGQVWPQESGTASGWRGRCHFIHQDLGLIPTLSAAENLALAAGYRTTRVGRINWRRLRTEARAAIGQFGGDFDVTRPASTLSPAERTIVAIARALNGWTDADALLILDEPTASLHGDEVHTLFEAIRRVRNAGAGVLFVSHRVQEVLDLADRVAVLRDGRVVADRAADGLTPEALVTTIVGRPVDALYADSPPPHEAIVMSVRDLAGVRARGISFDLHQGEILGVTGLVGSGREELAHLLFGSASRLAGSVVVGGREVPPHSVRASLAHGIALVPGDRARFGAVMTHSVRENVMLSDLGVAWRRGRLSRDREHRETSSWIERMQVKPRDPERRMDTLSGGNQQKAVLAKWLRTVPRVMLLDEPAMGVDVGAKAVIFRHLAAAASNGAGLVICSSEAKDLVSVCDRVLVLYDGAVAAVLQEATLSEDRIVAESLGSEAVAVG